MKISIFFCMFSAVLLVCCTSTKNTSLQGERNSETVDQSEHLAKFELIDLLRNQPGLEIRGSGNYYKILVRGHKSIQGDNDPLYVLDGVALGRKYSEVAGAIDVMQVDKVKIIPATRAGIYGSRGQNGVIEIISKKNIY